MRITQTMDTATQLINSKQSYISTLSDASWRGMKIIENNDIYVTFADGSAIYFNNKNKTFTEI